MTMSFKNCIFTLKMVKKAWFLNFTMMFYYKEPRPLEEALPGGPQTKFLCFWTQEVPQDGIG